MKVEPTVVYNPESDELAVLSEIVMSPELGIVYLLEDDMLIEDDTRSFFIIDHKLFADWIVIGEL